MKKLLLALMLCLTALAGTVKVPEAESACHRWRTRYYYPAGNSVPCGSTHFYCEAPAVHTGCTTPYHQDFPSGCVCP